MQIIIMRHGEAVVGADNDASRPLTSRGEQQAQSSAAQLAKTLQGKTCCFASPYRRAQQTAQLTCDQMPGVTLQSLDQLTPMTSPAIAIAAVDKLLASEAPDNVILVAHMPIVARLTALLTGESEYAVPMFSTACAVVLETDVLAAGCATLRDFVQPG